MLLQLMHTHAHTHTHTHTHTYRHTHTRTCYYGRLWVCQHLEHEEDIQGDDHNYPVDDAVTTSQEKVIISTSAATE